jgi:hypothetical protein
MLTRSLIDRYLEPQLGDHKNSRQGLMYCCPKCDEGNKYNLEVNLDRKIFNCWSCRYSGVIQKLLREHSADPSWRNLPEFRESEEHTSEDQEKPINYPTETIPIHLNEEVKHYLVEERGMDLRELTRRGVSFCYSENEQYHNHICFPFYKEGRLVGACLQNFATKKYRNLGKFDFVPWEEFVNPAYPVTIAEGAYDGLSGINSILLRGTEIYKAILQYIRGKDVILAVDNKFDMDHFLKILEQIKYAEPRALSIFDLKEYDDLNHFYVNDKKGFFAEYRQCFNDLKNK